MNCCHVPKGSRRKHWDSESIHGWLETAELVRSRVYSCSHCWNHVCLHDDIISKDFQVNNFNKDYLFLFGEQTYFNLAPSFRIKIGRTKLNNQ
ncbi:hypothetical protein ZWY2020_038647 [Hordeum vulgare]|nr:hypothetical protein ZWY2020_038647 [Hordeum vulgare]